jgi:hypothetical protein
MIKPVVIIAQQLAGAHLLRLAQEQKIRDSSRHLRQISGEGHERVWDDGPEKGKSACEALACRSEDRRYVTAKALLFGLRAEK